MTDQVVEIRRVEPDDWPRVKAIRLAMLADTPTAYITTYEEAAAFPDSLWIDRCVLGSSSAEQATYLGLAGSEVVAMGVGLRRPQHKRIRQVDVLVIVSVFVSAEHRGTGVADRLMTAIEEWGISWGAPVATLWVTETNDRAAAFYNRIGYIPTKDRAQMGSESALFEVRLEKDLRSGS